MKKITIFGALILSLVFYGCSGQTDAPQNVEKNSNDSKEAEAKVEETVEPIAFADIHMDIMDASDKYNLFTFKEAEGDCMTQGFPKDLVYTSDNIIKTTDESYVEDWTSVDFTGKIRFDEVPLNGGKAACVIATTKGVTRATLSCSTGEGEEAKEVCTGSFKLYASK